MTNIKNLLRIRVLSLFLSITIMLGMIPLNIVFAYATDVQLGTLSCIMSGGTVTNADGSDATITYSSGAVLDYSEKAPSIGRAGNGWWIGLKMTAPDDMVTKDDFKGVTLKSEDIGNNWSDPISFWDVKGSNDNDAVHFVELWGMLNEERLNDALTSGKTIQYHWEFDWNADGIYEQTATLAINPNNIVLKKDGATVYPSAASLGTVTAYSEELIVSNGTGNYVEASLSSPVTISWLAADDSVGRKTDGWFIGMKVVAPDHLATQEDFDEVTFKSKCSSNEWSDAMPFWENRDLSDSDAVHHIGLWGLLTDAYLENAIASGDNVEYSWKFDWDKDGIYEQQVDLNIDPSMIVLKDADNNQVFPSLGTVSTYTGGKVSSDDGHVTVTVDETVLDWSPKNLSIGRNIDAWWVGVKVTAPNYTVSILQNSKLKYKSASATKWSDVISFWDSKDSADGDVSHFVGLWMPLTPATIAEAKEAGNNIVSEYQFDWDNDGTFEQLITIIVVPGDGIVLNKVNQTGFAFVNESPVDQWAGASFTNTATGGQSTGTVKYSIVSGNEYATIDENSGTVSFSAAGTIKVRATKNGDDTYNDATAEYTVTSVRYPQTEFKFKITNPGSIPYADGKTFENEATGGSGTGAIKYEIISGESYAKIDENTGVVTFLKAGDITVEATKAGDAFYEATTVIYNLKIDLGTQDPLIFAVLPDNNNLVYRNSVYESAIGVTGGSGTGALKFSIVDGGENATITTNGKITTLKEGSFRVRVEKDGDGLYDSATPIEVTLNVIKAEQTTFAFTYPSPSPVTYNENGNIFVNPAINGESTGAVIYEIVNMGGDSIVDVSNDGTLTIKRAGEVTIRATKAADTKYNEDHVEYTLVIQKAGQTFSFADGDTVSKYYGTKTYRNEIVYTAISSKADGKGYGSGTVTYEVYGDSIGATASANGTLNFADSVTKVGTITVKATKAEDACYNSCEKEYTLTVAYLPTPSDPFTLSGDTRNESGWYTDNVTIMPADGYRVSYSNELSTDDWADFVVSSAEGANSANIFLMNAEGFITDAISVDELNIDKTGPVNVDITYSTSLFDNIVETVTFGIYKAPVTVSLTATNVYSGIESFTYDLGGEKITIDKSNFTTNESGIATYVFTIDPQYRGVVTMTATATSGRMVTVKGSKTLVVDSEKPECTVSYHFSSGNSREEDGKTYTQGSATVYIEINEANFDISDKPVLKVDGVPVALVWTQNIESKEWDTSATISAYGVHTISLEYMDASTNEMNPYEKTIVIDDEAPSVVSLTYDNDTAMNGNYYSESRRAKIIVSEDYFKPEEFMLNVAATDVTGNDIGLTAEYLTFIQNPANWTSVGNIHTVYVDFDIDARYALTLNYTDISGNVMTEISDEFIIDATAPTVPTISYSTPIIEKFFEVLTLGFYNPTVAVTVISDDITAGVDYFTWNYTKEPGTSTINADTTSGITVSSDNITYLNGGKTAMTVFTVEADARGYITANVYDKAGNTSNATDSALIKVVDDTDPVVTVTYIADDANVKYTDVALNNVDSFKYATNAYFDNVVAAKISINEANFFEGVNSSDGIIHEVGVLLTKTDDNGVVTKTEYLPAGSEQKYADAIAQDITWTTSGDVHTFEITYSDDADYVLTIDYSDFSSNDATIISDDGQEVTGVYVSKVVTVDTTAPVIDVTFEPYDPIQTVNGRDYLNITTAATIKVTEHNFRAEDISIDAVAKDASGNSIATETETIKAISDYLKDSDNWVNIGDTHVATVSFTVDARYDVTIDYSDLIGNEADKYVAPSFVVDHIAPSNLTVSYSEEIKSWQKVLNTITFGYYSYNPEVKVTITAFDDISGVDFFTWTYTQENDTSTTKDVKMREVVIPTDDISYSADNKTATATFTLTGTEAEQFRGSISFVATDTASNESSKYDDNTRINIVDTISPTRVVSYSDAIQVVDADTLKTKSMYKYDGEDTKSILYYNDDVTVTVKVTEANFYAEDVIIRDNDVEMTLDNWTRNGDEWTATFKLASEGDHIVTMSYTDRSDNKMDEYKSQRIVIDRTLPIIDVQYKNVDVKNTVRDSENHDRKYFENDQSATITITEHNFRPDDVVIKVKAKDVVGSNVATLSFDGDGNVKQYANEGKSREEWAKLTPYTDLATWRRNGDTFKLVINYTNDANYTFDIEYKDLAGNAAAVRQSDYFTIDNVAPKNLTVSYSTSVYEKILESITFGYYNAQMTVTITAVDDTSGIYRFLYSYVKSEGVSKVNAELIDDAISNANIRYDGAKATATFTIPKYVLVNNNQFNGTVKFTAYDRTENSTDKDDSVRIIVDNIKPVLNVTYNEPIKKVNNTSYYSDTASVKVDINEANFFEEDVHITVTKDGNSYTINDLKWTHTNVDEHSGRFTLSDDGDYIVTVTYTDRSGNVMDSYQSNQITVDKTIPEISVSTIKNNTANKDEIYTFTITASDANINFETFKPKLRALVKNEDGNYTVKTISIGDIKTVEAGKVYSFTIQNLDADAAYTLTCEATDMSGNECSSVKLDDGNEYENVCFSINRDGSTFAANEFTADLVEKYYVYKVENDIVLDEINVDPIEEYVVKLNGKAIEEDKDYITTITDNDGEWSKRTYIIHKDLFEDEGEYSIVIESTDKASTKAYSDVKNLRIAFVVDKTEPALTVSGVEDGGRYQIDEQPVIVIPTDDGGRLFSFKAIVLDVSGNPLTNDGKDISVRFDMSGEEFLSYLEENEGKIKFTIPEGLENQVQLICSDCALKDDGTTNEYISTYTKVTVSQSGWVIFYANKPLFYGLIGGVIGSVGLAIGLIVFTRKKRKAEKADK